MCLNFNNNIRVFSVHLKGLNDVVLSLWTVSFSWGSSTGFTQMSLSQPGAVPWIS